MIESGTTVVIDDKEAQTVYLALQALKLQMTTDHAWMDRQPFRPALTIEEINSLQKRIGQTHNPYDMKEYLIDDVLERSRIPYKGTSESTSI